MSGNAVMRETCPWGGLSAHAAARVVRELGPALPDGTGAVVLLPSLRAAGDFAAALREAAARPLLLPRITTLQAWAADQPLPRRVATRAEREVAVCAALAQRQWLDTADLWSIAAELCDLVDELTRHAVELGVHGCLVLPPFFLKGVSDRGIVDAYRWVIDRCADPRLRLYLYHIPQVAGVGLSQAVIADLLDRYPHVIAGIKDSACDRSHSTALARAFMPPLTVYVGFEPDLQTLGRMGSTGAISGLANFAPRLVHRLVTQPDAPEATRDQSRVLDLLKIFEGFSLMPALKAVMAQRDGDERWLRVRPPLVALAGQQLDELKRRLLAFGLDPADD